MRDPKDCDPHYADNQGFCHNCGKPMGISDDEWEMIQKLRKKIAAEECYFDLDGTLMTHTGERSIFDDVDQ